MTAKLISRSADAALHMFPHLRAVQPFVGIVPGVSTQPPLSDTAEFFIGATQLGDLSATMPSLEAFGDVFREGRFGGAGTSVDEEIAKAIAVAEALERYCMVMLSERDYLVATADELGEEALDWRSFPKPSVTELADPECPVRPFDPGKKIRWIRGYSLTRDCKTYVPLTLTHLYQSLWEAERFSIPISTGVAAHSNMSRAIVSAICEVVERDAIALTWLARLPLSRLEIGGDICADARIALRAAQGRRANYAFFDATTDTKVPTILCVQTLEGHPWLSQVVSCATSISAEIALTKAVKEAACVSTIFAEGKTIPENVRDFTDIMHGSSYMGLPERRVEFEFLLNSPEQAAMRDLPSVDSTDPDHHVGYLRDRFRQLGHDVVLVDLTVGEVREYGMHVVRAIVPSLMPMSFVHRARFLGHPRLYEYTNSKGVGVKSEREVNPAPMPFA